MKRISVHMISLWLIITLNFFANSHRIVGIFIHTGPSHFRIFYPIMNGLAERGHDVTVVSLFRAKNPHPNYKEILIDGGPEVTNSTIPLSDYETPSSSALLEVFKQFFSLYRRGAVTCQRALSSAAIDEILKTHKQNPFDLVVTEIFNTDCMLGVIHKMNLPFIGISSCALMPYHYDRVALPDTPSYIPTEYVSFSDKMDFMDRFFNWITTKGLKMLYRIVERNDMYLLSQKFGNDIPDVRILAKQMNIFLVNQHYSFGGPRPLSPSVIEIGGVHIKEPKELPNDLKLLLDSNSKNGVIFISWGSNIKSSTLSEEKLNVIFRVLEKLPHQIIWKWESNSSINMPKNVFVSPWVPQRDVLCHPNIKLFWSHGGILGLSEAIHCGGVPIIVTPIYGDQFLNAAAVENRKIGVKLPFNDLMVEIKIQSAIEEALKPSCVQNAKIISYSFKNRPLTPLKTAIWWIEHVLATGGIHLEKSHSMELTWFAYHSVDVMLVLLAAVIFVLLAVALIVKKMYCTRKPEKVKNGKLKLKKL